MRKLVIGSRGSTLALWQTNFVRSKIMELHSGLEADIKIIKTAGDKELKSPLYVLGGRGLFTKELNTAVLAGEIDCAVHSLKDLPTGLPEGIILGAVLHRPWRGDVFVSPSKTTIDALPGNATIAAGSLRRRAFLLHHRPDLRFVDIRGNIDTRLRKVREAGYDGLILAEAGMKRLGLGDSITHVIDSAILPPAPAQGALGITVAADNGEAAGWIQSIDEPLVHAETSAERSFLHYLEGGCHVPIGAAAFVHGRTLNIEGSLASIDGTKVMRKSIEGNVTDAEKMGKVLAEMILESGGKELLDEVNSLII